MIVSKYEQIGIIVGPGHHHKSIIEAFKKKNLPFRYAVQWPKLEVRDVHESGLETVVFCSKLYDFLSYILWGIWSRLPFIRKKKAHLDLLFPLYDFLVSRFFENYDKVLGWSQVSFFSIKKVKKRGGTFILEHPMVHVLEWMNIMEKEYKKWPIKKGENGLFSSFMVKRMLKEYKIADKINLLSTYSNNTFLKHGVPERNLNVILPGIDDSFFTPSSSFQKKYRPYRFLFVGRLELLKGFHNLLKVFSELNLDNAELILAGPVLPEADCFLSKNKENVKIVGNQKKEQLRELYRNSDVLVLPSLQESFGLVMLEALACGCYVLASESCGAKDLTVIPQVSLFDPFNFIKLKEEMQMHYDLKKNNTGMPFLLKAFSSEAFGKRMEGLLFNTRIKTII